MLKHSIIVFLVSMVPLIELRGAIPYGVAFGLPLWLTYIIAIVGNMLPVPLIYFFARKVLEWGRDKPVIGKFFTFCLEKGKKGGEKLQAKAGRGLFWALLLFVGGVAFCYCLVFPMAIDLFWSAADGVASTLWSVKEYFNFVLSFVLPFGLMFELPVVVYMLARRGLVTYQKLAHSRKYVILVIAIIAAILTPPDAVSQCMLAIPMILLYEVAAQLARLVKPKKPAEA